MCHRLLITDRDREGRYERQTTLPQIVRQGQARLAAATVVVVGCGELGTVAAELLAQTGVGRLYLVDDDYAEIIDLDWQILLGEEDTKAKRPKAMIAAERVRAINTTSVEPIVTRLTPANADELLKDVQLILDGTDNDATRHVLNRVCVKQDIPWVFATVAESHGLTMNIVPGETPCFACVFGKPGRQSLDRGLANDQKKGLLPTITHIVASLQVGQAIKLLLGDEDYNRDLLYVDAWDPLLKRVVLKGQQGDCCICGR